VIAKPPSEAGVAHDTNAPEVPTNTASTSRTTDGATAGTPSVTAVLPVSSVPFALVIVTTFTSYVVPLINPENDAVVVFSLSVIDVESTETPPESTVTS
jgi:hypothetical protein